MPYKMSRRAALVAGSAALVALGAPRIVRAATMHNIDMLNVHPEDPSKRSVFFPELLVIEPGDTIKFLSVDPGHNSQSIPEMMPEGAENWNGRIGEEIEVTLEIPGYYGYKCLPHEGLGMVGLVIVPGEGMEANVEAAKAVRHRGLAQRRFEEIWAEADALEFPTEA